MIRRTIQKVDRSGFGIEYNPFEHGNHIVTRQGIGPNISHGPALFCSPERHCGNFPFILTERSDLTGVGRPGQYGPFGPSPAMVIRSISVILFTIFRDLILLARFQIMVPDVVISPEGPLFPIWSYYVLGNRRKYIS